MSMSIVCPAVLSMDTSSISPAVVVLSFGLKPISILGSMALVYLSRIVLALLALL